MKQRRTHNKSRRGCLNCKKRHVKCDEQGPPCANCVVRNSDCRYPSPTGNAAVSEPRGFSSGDGSPNHHIAVGQTHGGGGVGMGIGMGGVSMGGVSAASTESGRMAGSGSGGSLTFLHPDDSFLNIALTPNSSVGPSSVSPSSSGVSPSAASPSVTSGSYAASEAAASEARKVMELEFMHRWSTSTFKVMCCLPEDQHLSQTVMPREALKHPFLLHIMFALTALDIAINDRPAEREAASYIQAAMEYYDLASNALRSHLANPRPDEGWLLYLSSTAMAVYNMGLFNVAPGRKALDYLLIMFEVWGGASTVGFMNIEALFKSPITSLRSMIRPPASHDSLDEGTRMALARLHTVNGVLHDPNASPGEYRPKRPLGPLVDPEPASPHELYRRCIYHLATCYAEDLSDEVKNYCMSFPGWAGLKFSTAVGDSEPVALLIVMHLAVLIDRMGKDSWWAGSFGKSLVAEITVVLRQSQLILLTDGLDAIGWARRQVGLPSLML